jgi:hypothetical protein
MPDVVPPSPPTGEPPPPEPRLPVQDLTVDPAPPRTPRTRAPGAYTNLPLGLRFALALLVAGVLLAVMIVWVRGHNTDSPPSTNPASQVRANREAGILIEQDQAPHTVRLPAGVSGSSAMASVVHARMARQVASGVISGPLRPARCRPGGRAGTRTEFRCTIDSGSVNYLFTGVVDSARGRVTYCKRDLPPVPSENIPVSRRCRA